MADLKFVSKVNTPDGTSYDIKDAHKSGVYPVIGTQTAATNVWTGALHGVNALYDGLTIMYYLPWAGTSTAATLNLTLDNGTSTGAINCYYSTSRLTTHYGKGCNIIMTYHSAGSIKVDGTATTDNRWIANANYADGNSDTKVTQTADDSTNSNFEVIMSNTADNTTRTEATRKSSKLKFNPSTGNLQATQLNGVTIGSSPKFTDTDTKVTSSANHYTPATVSGQDKTASASGATAAWSIDVVKGITLNTDGKGHVTGLSVTSGKIPANPNTDTKVSQLLVSDSLNRPILMAAATNTDTTSTITDGSRRTNNVYINSEDGMLTATKFNVAQSATIQFNSTTQSLDFIFA